MATKNLVGNPNGVLETEVNQNVSKSGFGQGISPSHFYTCNEGEIKIHYDELLEPNSEIRISNQYLVWQSPLVTRNLTNQRVRTYYIAQSIKNMWADYRAYMFGGRYGDFTTPELHFHSNSSASVQYSGTQTSVDEQFRCHISFRLNTERGYTDWAEGFSSTGTLDVYNCLEAFKANFLTYFVPTTLGEALGFQTETFFTDLNTPNPWPFMAYLNFFKWFVANKYVLRGNSKMKKTWFPDNEDDFKFRCGPNNKSTGVIGRFFSPEPTWQSGFSFVRLNCNIKLTIDERPFNPTTPKLPIVESVTVVIAFKILNHATGEVYSSSYEYELPPSSFHLFDSVAYSSSTTTAIKNLSMCTWLAIFDACKNSMLQSGIPIAENVNLTFLDLFETRYMNFNKDYFTGGLISPLIAGDYPSIAYEATVSGLEAETTLSGGSVTSSIHYPVGTFAPSNTELDSSKRNVFSDVNYGEFEYAGGLKLNQFYSHNLYTNDSNQVIDRDDVTNSNIQDLIDRLTVTSVISSQPTATTTITGSSSVSGTLTIPMLRLLSATTDYLEALARSDGDYRNMVLAIYGVKPTEVSEAPILLGASSGFVQTQNIFQTSPTDGQPLGTVSQTGYAGGSDRIGFYFAKDTTVILGLSSIVPEIFYYQGVPKKWVMRHKEEHQNPKFNGISMQAIENRELFVSGNDSTDTDPFSYAPAWEFMRHRQNRLSGLLKPHFNTVTGQLLDKPFTQMVQSRGWLSTPDFNDDFVSTKYNISTEHLYTQDVNMVPEFTFAIKNNVQEILPITKSGVPQRI